MNQLYISMYHYTRDLIHSRYPKIKGMDVSQFRRQIEYMKNNFNIVSMEQVIDAIKNNYVLPEKSLLLTFDDGYVDNYTYAMPILEEYSIQGSFFVLGKTFETHELLDVNKLHYILASANINDLVEELKVKLDFYRGHEFDYATTDELWHEYAKESRFDGQEINFVKKVLQTALPEGVRKKISSDLFEQYVGITEEKLAYELYLTEDQIRTMKRHGMFIGLHGYNHYWLGNLSYDDMKADIDMGLDALDEFIDRDCWVMNYPYGSYNQKVIDYVKSKGACLGLCTEVRIAKLGEDNLWALPRLDCNDFPPKSSNYLNY